jgi:hypothetical protein
VNGDGFADLIIGAPLADPGGNYSGASYVVFGGTFAAPVAQLGTAAADTLTDSATVETVVDDEANSNLSVLDVLDSSGAPLGLPLDGDSRDTVIRSGSESNGDDTSTIGVPTNQQCTPIQAALPIDSETISLVA